VPESLVDAGERRRAVEDLDTTLLVEAAAGSGKTTLLLARIVALVRAGRARLREIAAITFTEKAAAELRIRLRAALEQAQLDEALRDLEAARIGTIHSFAAGLLRERPVEAGVDPAFTVADPLAAALARDAAWERFVETSLSDPAPSPGTEAVRRAVELGIPLAGLRALAFALADERDTLYLLDRPDAPGSAAPPPAELDQAARARIASLEVGAARHARDPEDKAAAAIAALGAWARQTAGLPEAERVQALVENAPIPDKPEKLGAQTKWRPAERLLAARHELGELRDAVGAARAAARHDLAAALAGWARGFADAYQVQKARAGQLDFHDLLLRARDLIRDRTDVRAYFQRRIRYLLVDEFQDTDPLQLEMILDLTAGAPPGSLFIVGDPKQSIYRFRRADIETYQAARAVLATRGAVLAIRANFRSTAALLDATNRVFDGAMVPPPDGAYQPDYVPLEPGPDTVAGRPPVLLRPPDGLPPPRSVDEARAQEAGLVAAYLRREVTAGAFKHGDVVLLFRAMTGVTAYEDAFRAAGIPFRTVGGRHYYDRSEVGWAIAALVAIEDPHDPVALVGALRSPFFGIPDPALAALRKAGGELCYLRPLPPGAEPGLAAAWALLAELHRERNALTPPAVVERLYTRTQVLATYALDLQGEARVANLLKVLDTARALEGTGSLTFRALVRWLRDRGAARYEEEESVVADEGDDAVRLMTIHKAKGLEFPVVVLPGLDQAPAFRPGPLLVDRRAGELALRVGTVRRAGREEPLETREWDTLAEREERRAAAETLRLLYVALTRAAHTLVLPLTPGGAAGSFLAQLGPLLDGATEMLDPEPEPPSPAPGGPAAPGAPAPERRAEWLARRTALLAGAAQTRPVLHPAAGLPGAGAQPAARPTARRIGALVHAALAAIDLDRPDTAPAVVAALAARQGVPVALAERAARLVARALRAPVLARARQAPWVAREVPVSAEVEGVLVEGRVDLLFEDLGGLVAVEIKTDADPDAGEEQARLYAAALGRALGRPVGETVVLRLGG
jgi:ATP-dependent helicase/nuclease subunit A